ncbi:Omega Transcriptional Repressor [Lactococcus chungangensis CAU 28 = DSM 22330]|uniref:Omega Transcriptional Repressor n=2 Tax=Pseudolactococcus chungangensis CAU 28 = DSM 22330 TaxID=1122154 RepID=A0A1K2HJF3_9LACT|nr:Omega Transcriptional Repressor [Lactococcus chungangensis CAU 28 = DSM 22330]
MVDLIMGLDDFIKKTGKIETPFEKKENIKKTTKLVKIDEDLHKKLKIYSALNGTNIKDNTEQAIREFLEKYKQ